MDEKDRRFLRMVAVMSTAVLTPAFSVLIGFFIGLWLDRWLGTSPWLTAVFLLFGVAAGVRDVYRFVRRGQKMFDEDGKDNDKHDG